MKFIAILTVFLPFMAFAITPVCDRSPTIVETFEKYFRKPCDQITKTELESINYFSPIQAYPGEITYLKKGDLDGLINLNSLQIYLQREMIIVPEAFDNLPRLTYISFYENKKVILKDGDYSNLIKLDNITFNVSQVELPVNFFSFLTNLTTMSVYKSSVGPICNSLTQNLNLKRLEFRENSLGCIPIINSNVLESFSLENNKIQVIPSDKFKNLPALKFLNLSDNSIASIDSNVFDGLSSLASLKLRNSQISQIHESVFSSEMFIKNDIQVDLQGNALPPEVIERLKKQITKFYF